MTDRESLYVAGVELATEFCSLNGRLFGLDYIETLQSQKATERILNQAAKKVEAAK